MRYPDLVRVRRSCPVEREVREEGLDLRIEWIRASAIEHFRNRLPLGDTVQHALRGDLDCRYLGVEDDVLSTEAKSVRKCLDTLPHQVEKVTTEVVKVRPSAHRILLRDIGLAREELGE